MTGTLNMATQNQIRFQDTAGGEFVGFRAPATISASYTLNLPTSDGSADQVLSTDGAGNLSWLTVPTGATNAHVFSYDTTNQTVSTANTFQDITFSNNGSIAGWTHAVGTATFTCNTSGFYLVMVNARCERTTTGTTTMSLRVNQNGVEVPGSQTSVDSSTSNQALPMATMFVVSATNGDTIVAQFTGTATTNRLVANNGSGTTRPSITITIVKL